MSIDNIADISPRIQYVATAAQTDFDYPFPIFEDTDLVVDVDGVTQAITTDYTVSGEGEDNGGTVTFVTPMAGNEVVTIYRDMAVERLTDFQQNGPYSSASLNDDLDRITLVLQDLKSGQERSLRFSPTSEATAAQTQFSPIANWLDKFVYINASGIPEPATAVEVDTLSQSVIAGLLYPQTAAEAAAGITPVNLAYEPGDYRRLTVSTPDAEGNVTFTVGTTGFFLNINEALSLLTKRPANGTEIVLQLISGFTMAEQVVVANGQNYGYIRLESVDATVPLTMSALTVSASAYNETPTGNLPNRKFAFFAYNGSVLPKIGVLFVASSSGAANANYVGILLHGGSHVTGLQGCGIQNLVAVGGGNDSRGLNVTHASTCEWWGADFSGCDIAVRASNTSIVTVRNGDVSGSRIGIDAGAGVIVNCQSMDASACTQHAIFAQGTSAVHADSINCTDTGNTGTAVGNSAIRAEGVAQVYAGGATLDGAGRGVDCREGAEVYLGAASIDNCEGYGLVADDGGRIYCGAASIDGAGQSATLDSVIALDGGEIWINGGTVRNNAAAGSGASGVNADNGYIHLMDVTVTGNGAGVDLEVKNGGVIHANGTTNTTNGGGSAIVAGDCNVVAFNRKDRDRGWIWSEQFGETETAAGTFTASLNIQTTLINSAGGAVTVTLPNGVYYGQRKIFHMTDATTSSTVSVTTHETSSPEVFTFADANDRLTLEWDGVTWWTVKNIGVAT